MPEHISLHLDRNSYFAGDRIWYALYLNNTPRSASSVSAVVYVELRDARDSVVTRQKVKCREGYGHADMLLSNKLRTGNYSLIAFTLWMKNNGGEEIYRTTIPIINLELPVIVSAGAAPQILDGEPLKISISSTGTFLVSTTERGKILAFDREEVLQVLDVAPGREVEISCGDRDHAGISFALVDDLNEVKAIKEVNCPQSVVHLAVDASKRAIKPRQKFEVSILLTDRF